MNLLDLVIRQKWEFASGRAGRMVAVAATALVLTLTPTVAALAGPESPAVHATATSRYQDEDPEQIIVPVSDDQTGDESNADDDVTTSDDLAGADDQPVDDSGDVLTTPGVISKKVDLQPNQWTGALDGRLVEPFAIHAQAASISAPSIGLNAVVTTRQIVGGAMQTPKDENEVSWYKETAAPGEQGNGVFAGHLNWYGVPQAVFYGINQLQKGDEIIVTDDQGRTFVYKVQWVKLVNIADADFDKIVGPTKKPSITLITCGGDWNPAASEYNQRTVVRAVLVTD